MGKTVGTVAYNDGSDHVKSPDATALLFCLSGWCGANELYTVKLTVNPKSVCTFPTKVYDGRRGFCGGERGRRQDRVILRLLPLRHGSGQLLALLTTGRKNRW